MDDVINYLYKGKKEYKQKIDDAYEIGDFISANKNKQIVEQFTDAISILRFGNKNES